MLSKQWSFFGVAFLLGASLSGCTCGDDKAAQPDSGQEQAVCSDGSPACQTVEDCPERNICRDNCCKRTYRKCDDKSDCCPGQSCTSEGRCVDSFDECTVDADCGEGGDRVCEEWIDPTLGSTRRCTFRRCESGACPAGQSCFADFCVASLPCGGSCPAGEACVPQTNKCHPFGDHCDLQPKPGFLVVFTDPANVYDVCLMANVACAYAELPPLPSGDLGRHASMTARDGQVHVAQYDGTYGDLVVSDYDAQGKLVRSAWVDGVPSGAPVVASPTGPRGGVAEPGPDVGKHTDLAVKPDGTLYVSYYDSTNGDLRFAERAADGTWRAPYAIDGTDADVGLHTSMALDAQGRPTIAYFQKGASESSTLACPSDPSAPKALVTGVKLAQATSEHPASAADWTIKLVACGARQPPPCFGCTTASGSKVCVEDVTATNGTRCATPATTCGSCAATEVCVSGGCMPKGSPAELDGIPAGVGLFPSLAFKGETPVIAWYDHNDGNLVVSQSTGSSFSKTIIDGEERGEDTGDVGLFPSLAIDAQGNYAIAYHDFTRRGLRFWSGSSLATMSGQATPPDSAFVDRGLSDPRLDGPSWVGADAALVPASFGTFVAYQNSTASDLRLSRKGDPAWSVAREWTEGAVGFFADAAEMGGKLYVVHTRIHTKTVEGKPAADNQLKLEIFAP